MLQYILKKLLYSLLVIWGVITLIFILFNVIPGDPARMVLGQRSDSASLAIARKDLGLDQSLAIQYVKYLNDLSPLSIHNRINVNSYFYYNTNNYTHSFPILRAGNKIIVLKAPYLRRSYQSKKGVSEILFEALPNTLLLATVAILFAFIVGIVFGIFSALNRDSWYDKSLMALASLGVSLPSFFAAIIVAWLFAYVLANYTGLNLTGNFVELDDMGNGVSIHWKNIILPAFTLGIRPLSVAVQLSRSSLLDVLSQDYIRTARAYGASTFTIIWKHALKNSLNPVITSLSGWFASMMAGVVFIEYIFGWKGLGYVIVNALNNYDVPLVMGAVIIISMIFVVVNILVDICYTWLDPRVKLN